MSDPTPRQTIQLTKRETDRLHALAAAAGVPKASLSDCVRIALAMSEDVKLGPRARGRMDVALGRAYEPR